MQDEGDGSVRADATAAKAEFRPEDLDFDKGGGLMPAIIQDARNLRVLMLGYMDRAALDATLGCGQVTFFSRSRQRQWRKGEASGHVLELVSITADCDVDTLLVQAIPRGPTCHTGRKSCFPQAPASVLAELDAVIEHRRQDRPAASYTARLFESGVRHIAQKVGEEGVETALAAVVQDDPALLGEASDLAYHLLVLLHARGLGLRELESTLRNRAGS
jgi:phosphoribosyl-ATP pyrophosphohydrolase/phosphoribosyl-AMP cyclohydrolase